MKQAARDCPILEENLPFNYLSGEERCFGPRKLTRALHMWLAVKVPNSQFLQYPPGVGRVACWPRNPTKPVPYLCHQRGRTGFISRSRWSLDVTEGNVLFLFHSLAGGNSTKVYEAKSPHPMLRESRLECVV